MIWVRRCEKGPADQRVNVTRYMRAVDAVKGRYIPKMSS